MTTIADSSPGGVSKSEAPSVPRLWIPAALVCLYWGYFALSQGADWTISTVFMSRAAGALLLILLFSIWWLANRSVPRTEKWFAFAVVFLTGAIAAIASHKSVGVLGVLLFGAPISLTVWLVWIALTRRRTVFTQRLGLVVLMGLAWSLMLVLRVEGIDGSSNAQVVWRWSRSAEDEYLASRQADRKAAGDEPIETLALQPGDWPEFRGPNRLGEWHGPAIATNWSESPPKELWRRRIGPAWSSVLVIGDRLFTQEQRGPKEVVVCLESATGKEIWAHEDEVRFFDGQAGAGPRATPTFWQGRIYSLGGTGILNCLDAASGKARWQRDIVADSSAPLPMWGFSSSPLVAEGVVSVYAGGKGDQGLLGYDAETGERAWSGPTGPNSYSSPQLVSLAGKPQVVFLSDQGLISVEPKSGATQWSHEAPRSGIWRVVQPRQIDDNTLLVGSEDLGLVRLDISPDEQPAKTTPRWSSRALRPAYNDFVVDGDYVYGFDEGIFCCVDLQQGKRQWKGGRYGHGQVLLLADQHVLLVVSETGQVVLLAATPEKHEELGSFPAVEGKTWNHPVVAHGRLFVRNDREIACFELRQAEAP